MVKPKHWISGIWRQRASRKPTRLVAQGLLNRPFPSSHQALFQKDSTCKIFVIIVMSSNSVWMKTDIHYRLFARRIAFTWTGFSVEAGNQQILLTEPLIKPGDRGWSDLENGLLGVNLARQESEWWALNHLGALFLFLLGNWIWHQSDFNKPE